MKFLSTSVLLGILSGSMQNGYNLINSPLYAKEAGLTFFFDECDKINVNNIFRNIIKISVNNNEIPFVSVQGTNILIGSIFVFARYFYMLKFLKNTN